MYSTYHMIHVNARYSPRRVRCYETGRYHRHQFHTEEYARAICGVTLVRDRDQFCNVGIADPRWDYDWCPSCVKLVPWSDKGKQMWVARGLEAMNSEEWKAWVESPEARAAFPSIFGDA